MSTYKLYYFNIRGRAEVSRMLFRLGGQEFEDIRYSFEEWPSKKADTPYGQLPYMEVDGESLCQSHTIERLLAKRFNRYGGTDMEQAKADMIVDCLEDMGQSFFKNMIGVEDKDKNAEIGKKWLEESFADYSSKLEKMATPAGFIPGKSVMWPDLQLFSMIDAIETVALGGEKIDLSKAPKLLAITKVVAEDPKIAEWIKIRPESKM